jgi:hypothetical protein
MKTGTWIAVTGLFAMSSLATAQQMQEFRAQINGRGGGEGKCTIEVVVDGVVEIEIRGDRAFMRNMSGNPPQWRRFECNSVPAGNSAGFRFDPQDGRGRQELLRDPRNGGPAVIRIDDPQGGSDKYKFDFYFGGGGQGYPGGGRPPDGGYPGGGYPGGGGGGNRYTREQAIRACQDNVSDQARDRWRGGSVTFRRIDIDDNPGRNDWVVGTLAVRLRGDREEVYRFSCSVDFRSGSIRSARIEDAGGDGGYRPPDGGGGSNRRAIESCQRAVEQRLRRDGYDRVDFRAINVDGRPGRGEWIVGDAVAMGRNRDAFDFSCQVNFGSGDIRNVDVRRR